jgi:uncharacterized protein
MAASPAKATRKFFPAPISTIFGNIDPGSRPLNAIPFATLISRPKSTRGVRSLARELGLGALSELPAAPCLSSRVETGLAIRAEVLQAIHTVERSIARDFPAGIVRCRVRAKGVVIELDPETLAAMTGKRKDEVRAQADRVFAGIAQTLALSFEPYRSGSAFVHLRA